MMTNMLLAILALAAAPPANPNTGTFFPRDRALGVTPAQNYFVPPPKVPDCRNQAEVDAALRDKQSGEFERCDPERFLRPRR